MIDRNVGFDDSVECIVYYVLFGMQRVHCSYIVLNGFFNCIIFIFILCNYCAVMLKEIDVGVGEVLREGNTVLTVSRTFRFDIFSLRKGCIFQKCYKIISKQ